MTFIVICTFYVLDLLSRIALLPLWLTRVWERPTRIGRARHGYPRRPDPAPI